MDDWIARIALGTVMVLSGSALIWMARAAASGRLKRNDFAGIRIRSTMVSEEAWLAAHVRAKGPTLLAGFSALASGALALLPQPMPLLAVTVVAGCFAMLGFVAYGAWVGARAAREVSGSGPPDHQL